MAPATEISPQAQRWFAIGGLAWLLAATAWLSAWRDDHAILINTTESLPNWAFFIDKHRRPQRGDFVVFTPPVTPIITAHFGQKSAPFAKRVYGMPGDFVTREGNAAQTPYQARRGARPGPHRAHPGALLLPWYGA